MTAPWVVLKFGGTSVATATNWGRIAARVHQLRADGKRVWIVASALSQVSNHLERAIEEAVADRDVASYDWITAAHEALAGELGLSDGEYGPVAARLEELGRLLQGIRLTREASPRLRARVMSFGELASTHLGIAALAKHDLAGQRVDARELLTSTEVNNAPEEARFLEATVQPSRDVLGAEAAADACSVVLTQGFIARTPDGHTCLLGRGGSDTSAALFAALIGAEALEIWTDVHGMFTTDPRQNPAARLIRRISYREAQELAAMGAKVLHPRCLGPCAWAEIPVEIRNTRDPDARGTLIRKSEGDEPAVMAVVKRSGVTLLTISTLEMWGAPGFLSRVFAPFEEFGISVDLVATSQAAVSLTLDRVPGGINGAPFQRLLERLRSLGEVEVVHPTAVVSIVGRRIRTVLHQLGPAMSVFREHDVHLVSESSEDLNISFVVDEDDAAKLVAQLHARLLPKQGANALFGPSWELLTAGERTIAPTGPVPWWRGRRSELLGLVADGQARYVYDLSTVRARARALVENLSAVSRIHYAMKANSHPDVLRTIADAGLAMECVSAAEVRRVRDVLGADVPILFTPNFCPIGEYEEAFEAGAEVTVDGPHIFDQASFAGREIAVRVDPGGGMGHHEKVVTAGAHAKFGHAAADLSVFQAAAKAAGATVTGLHSHVGSGILDPGAWGRTLQGLLRLRDELPDLQWIDVGGGLGVVERPGQQPLDLTAVNEGLLALAEGLGVQLRMEPGRYLVSEGGVLLAPVTQVRSKGEVAFVGLATGMNSLIRPALYGAWHGIHNLSRIDDPVAGYAHVVGPICETGDILGRDRPLPATEPGDVILIENAGAYGRVMSSSYNLRPPADEVCLPL
jgi:bifunctional diaminopimelate decarboxylase / aspartate kinase